MAQTQDQEKKWDKLLKIHTTGRDDSNADQYCYPYEPTPYTVLERLANSGEIRKNHVLFDYGCGKGRVDFFLAYQTRCRAIGIEYDERIYAEACKNKESAVSGARTEFVLTNAEQYPVAPEINRIFFFNPFSTEILKSVLARVLDSYYKNPRNIKLFFYYPQDEYLAYLMTVNELEFYDEIDCQNLFEGHNPRERIVIFETSEML